MVLKYKGFSGLEILGFSGSEIPGFSDFGPEKPSISKPKSEKAGISELKNRVF